MEFDRPPPGEELNRGAETVPRQAASIILLRGGDPELQVLLVKRTPAARFMGGAWVFPAARSTRARERATAPIAPPRCASCRRRPASSSPTPPRW